MACNDANQSMFSAPLKNDESAPKTSLQGCKPASPAAALVPPKFVGNNLPNLKILGISFGVYLSVGTICFYTLRDQIRGKKTNDLIDSLYLCVVTMTTVGYGDLIPHGIFAKLLSSVFTTVGMCLVGVLVKIAASFLVEKQEMMLVQALHMCQKLGPVTALKEIESIKISYKKCLISLIVMFGHYLIGIFMLIGVEDMDFMDAVYCASTNLTTLGYGDESFSTTSGRIFGIFWLSSGTSCLGQLFLYLAEVYTESQTKELAKGIVTRKITETDLEADVATDDGKVLRASGFIIHKLEEMGKISQEDISVAVKELGDFDVDFSSSGSKTMLVQSSLKK